MLQSLTGCHAPGTPILLLDGSTKLVEHVTVGDVLMGPDSTGRTVLALHRGRDDMFEIRPIKGEPFTVNAGHIMTLVRTNDGTACSGRWFDIALSKLLAESSTFRHVHKLVRVGVDFPSRPEPCLDPYFAGVLIGDGGLKRTADITTPDAEIVEAIYEQAASLGFQIRVDQTAKSEANTYYLVTARGAPNPLLERLAELGLRGKGAADKFLPDTYRLGSRQTRLNVLAGLLDTDGSLGASCFEFSSRSIKLALDVVFVARSLGFRSCIAEKLVNGESYWRVNISGHTDSIPTRIVRKQAAPRRQVKDPLRTGFTVHPVGPGEFFGFEVDGDHRYVMGDFTVTHNSGKTGLAAMIVAGALRKSKRVIFCVPAISLINQTVEAFAAEGITEVGVIQANHPMTDWQKPIQIASVQSLMNRKKPTADLVVVDEAHIWFKFMGTWMRDPDWANVPFVGLSATPWKRGLGKFYDDLLIVTTTRDLIDNGFLAPFRVFAPSHPDLAGVKTVAGDFHEQQLADAMNKPQLVADAVENWLRHGENRPTLCFAVNRPHAKELQQQFEAAGVRTGYVDAFTPIEERDRIGAQLRRGDLKVVTNVGCLTTGIDWDCRCIVLCRPTKSEMLFVQIIGRGLRLADGKTDCLVFDHSDTHERLGFVTDIHHESLDKGAERQTQEKRERPKIKECPECHFVEPAKAGPCTACGFKPTRKNQIEHEDGELRELGAGDYSKLRTSRAEEQRWFSALIRIGHTRSYKPGWAAAKFKDKFGYWPRHLEDQQGAVDPDIANWVKAQQIRYAKRRAA